jgi:transcriptional regulator with XRE-family HTH domain
MKQLFSIIREQRKRYKLSQTELARQSGISRASLSQIENGTITDIGIRKVERVLEFLGLELTVRPAGAPPTLDELTAERYAGKKAV